ncbi:hypothetical protein IMF23_08810 [Chelatococcus daeguensis]|uniref:Uncharacterized protein n=3 Tax=Chelatococcus TaxID=28209 RepID=A0A840C2P1_9HYPH|nr:MULTISPECIES: hypothetical protein [Chelatococcus]ALA16365.1 hypothetical protein AL346_01770 [Chelatococcus sp. CO-6]APF38064.1 hypothetical protein BOQ54_12600 [Chelatococcus daeguensis]KZE28569.1 hypothetical protein AVW15_07180 [Chelatococcus daeguensis]MBB4017918.1 hypothetical protein [Chelatococcus caeni]MBM3083531.1 hypothetical protein [Chelatococcus daeguensis]
MAYVTTDIAYVAPKKTGVFKRILNALVEARMRAADREIRRLEAIYGPLTLKDADLDKVSLGKSGALPFAR